MKQLENLKRLSATAAGGVMAVALLGATIGVKPARAEQPATTLQTLLDKQQIQDMLVDYYTHLGKGAVISGLTMCPMAS